MDTEKTLRPDIHHPEYARLRFRIALTVILVAIVPMVLVSGIILYQFDRFSNQMVHAHLGELVLKHRQNIDFFLRQRLSDISHLFRSFGVEPLRDPAFLQQRLQVLQEEYSYVFVDLGLIDDQGRQVAYAGPYELQRADYSGADWFRTAIHRQAFISDVFLGLRGHPHFIVAVKRSWEGREWLLRATIDFVAFNSLVENLAIGKTGMAFILNRKGEFQTRAPVGAPKLTKQQYLNLFKKGEDTLRRVSPGLTTSDLLYEGHGFADEYLDRYGPFGSMFTVEKISEGGTRFIIVAAFLKDNQWLLIFQQEMADAFAQLKQTQLVTALVALFAVPAVVALAFLVAGRVVRRIARLDFEKELMNRQVIETGKLATIGELAAGIAHEINNPVAIMVEEAGWMQDLMSDGIQTEENRLEFERALRQIQTQGRRCKEITHKLLSFARKTEGRVQEVRINSLVQEVLELLSQRTRFANIEVKTELAENLPVFEASLTEMQQVLMNILQNAVDAMERTGGTITVSTRREGGHLRISITDTGPGIPAGNLARLFDPFFTTKPVGKGTGLGLSICYGIVHKMGGRIEVESQVGKGTTFHVLLPMKKTTAETQGE